MFLIPFVSFLLPSLHARFIFSGPRVLSVSLNRLLTQNLWTQGVRGSIMSFQKRQVEVPTPGSQNMTLFGDKVFVNIARMKPY